MVATRSASSARSIASTVPRPRALSERVRPGAGDRRRRGARCGRARTASFTPAARDLAPYVDARYSLLDARVRSRRCRRALRDGDHVLEPSVEYFFPTFDGDSIFNAFSIEPTTDVRLGYAYAPTRPRGAAPRRVAAPATRTTTTTPSFAGGGDAGDRARARRELARRASTRSWDDGYGGRRIGGTAEAAWRPTATLWLRGRAIVLDVREDDDAPRSTRATTSPARRCCQLDVARRRHRRAPRDRRGRLRRDPRLPDPRDRRPRSRLPAGAMKRCRAHRSSSIAVLAARRREPARRRATDDWSPIVYPMQRLPLIFSHAKHLGARRDVRDVPPDGRDLALRRRQPDPDRGRVPRVPRDRSRRAARSGDAGRRVRARATRAARPTRRSSACT